MRRKTRTIHINSLVLLALAVASLWPAGSAAQSFPADKLWVPLHCSGQAVMTDLFRDQAGAKNERDIVGDVGNPAGLRAFDQSFLYLRLRLDDDPAPNGTLRPFAWGYELDTDGKKDTYEILLLVRGNDKLITLQRNTTTTMADSPSDPADEPPIATYPFSTHGRTVAATGSSFGGNDDYFLDIAIPWSDLAKASFGPTTSTLAWAGTSSTANSLYNGDLACHDGASGASTLSGTAPGPIFPVPPAVDSDKDGYLDQVEIAAGTNPYDPKSVPSTTVIDSDGDGYSDQVEIAAGTNPHDPKSFPQTSQPDVPIIAGGAGCTLARQTGAAGVETLAFVLPLFLATLFASLRRHKPRRA